jgi:hypothetical protein
LERRSRKRPRAASPARAQSRSEQRAAATRDALEPLAPAERPLPVTIGAVVAAVIAVANLAAYAAGLKINGSRPGVVGIVVLSGLMTACAFGLWRMRYWAVLGFQAMLALTVVSAALSLTVASNAAAVVLCVALIVLGGWLFYKLVRIMARIQMPVRTPRR